MRLATLQYLDFTIMSSVNFSILKVKTCSYNYFLWILKRGYKKANHLSLRSVSVAISLWLCLHVYDNCIYHTIDAHSETVNLVQ